MQELSRLDKLKAAYTKWEGNRTKEKVDAWRDLLADNCQIGSVDETRPGMSFAVDRNSKEESLAYLAAILDDWKMVYFRPETFVEQGDHIAMFGKCSWTHKGTGKTVECRISNLWTFNGNNQAVSMIDLFDSAKAAAAATPDKKQKKTVKKAAKTVGKKAVKQAAKADKKADRKAANKADKKAKRS
jgi:ketosteroid isomerase-like protein